MARFEGSIFDGVRRSVKAEDAMDEYAKFSLIMFFPFRALKDLMVGNSFRKKFIEDNVQVSISVKNKQILQNIQDIRNNVKLPTGTDALSERTSAYNDGKEKKSYVPSEFELEMEQELDRIDDMYENGLDNSNTSEFQKYCFDNTNITFQQLEAKGKKGIAALNISNVSVLDSETLITNEHSISCENSSRNNSEMEKNHRSTPTLECLLRVSAQRKVRCVKINSNNVKNDDAEWFRSKYY